MVNSIFDDADTNDDGLVDISESYILILRLYIKVNQKAPIKPPSRETADMLFNTADTDVSGMINKQEFLQLSLDLFASAGIRVLAYKLVSFLLAPLLATYLSGWLVTHPNNLTESAVAAARAVVPDSLEPSVFTQGTLTTILIVVFVSTLGHVFMDLVDTLLLRVGKAENEEAAKEAKRKDSLL
ncbi:hypothetical protein EMIHUDRAFT_244109 [Emiliania huxleyi CCMP1516]|uniref:EF-hand domain-containing protein n=2 Tax=Emiliania huxleyi TaxID=2903 RepID=A0A0D3J1W8_EMIH1|nr:hypothetical protein EMIHUDRAFT_244109 [Emiliania huxleyi CCMP1516]EOD17503.1 hypothetical protein EMIHUDRAFT_244109 [Emiliania huxleyi CCMP1516]|eukprot:XP_005769932.1 hypothetical protein EMIHUDRAFT_244109 [Emiliania huxleyi CCMP1516]